MPPQRVAHVLGNRQQGVGSACSIACSIELPLRCSVLSQWMNYSKRSTLHHWHYGVMLVAIIASTAKPATSMRMAMATCSVS